MRRPDEGEAGGGRLYIASQGGSLRGSEQSWPGLSPGDRVLAGELRWLERRPDTPRLWV